MAVATFGPWHGIVQHPDIAGQFSTESCRLDEPRPATILAELGLAGFQQLRLRF
jgi:hypothetical protein